MGAAVSRRRLKVVFIQPKEMFFVVDRQSGMPEIRLIDESRNTILVICPKPRQMLGFLEQISREIWKSEVVKASKSGQ